MYFSSPRKVFSGFAAPLFYCFSHEEFSAARFELIVFPLDTYEPSGAEGRARKA
jgi:hypothetical protein